MNTSAVVVLALSSSVIAAALTSFVTWRINAANYRREYYKKLLDRRLDAYERVEAVIEVLEMFIRRADGTLTPFVCAGGNERWLDFQVQLLQVKSRSVWLSDKVSGKLTELNVFLIDVEDVAKESTAFDDNLEEIGAVNADRFRRFRQELQALLFQDFRILSDIPGFVKRMRETGDVGFSPELIRRPAHPSPFS
ncbi:MAG TPA: hypothetical protein VHL57_01760 [Flavobacteriales bacterium]|jgi:hypothetical protein|nr:hypothetical protein [Flavobacteriales bacterium]